MYWCAGCGKNGRWSTTHHTGTHTGSSNKTSSDKWELRNADRHVGLAVDDNKWSMPRH